MAIVWEDETPQIKWEDEEASSVKPIEGTLDFFKSAIKMGPNAILSGIGGLGAATAAAVSGKDLEGIAQGYQEGAAGANTLDTAREAMGIGPSANEKKIDEGLGHLWESLKGAVGSGAVEAKEALKELNKYIPGGLRLPGAMGLVMKAIDISSEEALRSAVEGAVDFAAFSSMLVPGSAPKKPQTTSAKSALIADKQVEASAMDTARTAEATNKRIVYEDEAQAKFQGAQQQPLDMLPPEMQSPFGAMKPEQMTVDPYSGMRFNKELTDRAALEEQGGVPGIPVQQGDLFKGTSPDNPTIPILDSMPKKPVPELGEGQTPAVLQDAFRMSERAGEDPNMAPKPLAMGEASKPTLGPETSGIPYKPHLKYTPELIGDRMAIQRAERGEYIGPLGEQAGGFPAHVQEAIQHVTEGKGRSGLQQLADQKIAADRFLRGEHLEPNKGKFGQGGAVDPKVFLEGLQKVLGFIPRSLEAAREALNRKSDRAMDTRDTVMGPLYRDKLKELGQLEIGSKERGGPKVGKRQTKSETIQEDIGLVDRFKAGDSAAFTRIYEKYENRLEKMLARKTRDEAETADLVQDTFIRAAKALDTFDFRNGTQLFTWLYTIGQNVWKSKVTHDMSRIKTGELTPEMGETMKDPNMLPPDKILAERERMGQIQEAIDGLSENLQMAFRLKFEEEMSYKEIADLLDIPVGTVMSRISQARDTLAKQIAKMDREANVPRSSPYRGPGKKQAGAIGFDFKKEAKEKGVVKAVGDHLKQFDIERRTPLQMVTDGTVKLETLEDFGAPSQIGIKNKFANLKDAVLTNALIDKTISILSESKSGLGKIVKSIVDQNRTINRDAQVQIRESVDRGLPTFRQLMRTRVNRDVLGRAVDIWWDNVGKAKLQREHFPSEETFKAYTEISEMLSGVRTRVNEARAKYPDLTPLEFVENYLPGVWEGEYKVQVKDGNNVVVYQRAFNSERQAVAMQKELKTKYPEYDVPEPFLNKPTKEGLNSLEAFEETMRVMGKDNPITHAIQKTVNEILSRRSFGRHAAHKRGVEGSLGTEGGVKGLRNLEKALEQYVLQGENYIANLKKKELYGQLHELPVEVKAKIPQGLKYLGDYINQSKGVDMNRVPLVNDVVEATSVLLGQGRHGAERGLSKVMSVASIWWLATSRFFLSQPIQTANAIAKLVDMKQLDPNMPNPLGSYWEGWSNSIAPDASAKRGANWLKKEGYAESALVSMLNLSVSDIHKTKLGVFGDVFKWASSKLELHGVRMPAFMMFEHSLRESMPNETARFERAAELMDYYMVHYDSSSAPLAYEKLGVVGQAAKPLKQYAHNMWGQFLEYAQTAKDQGRLAPLGTFLATQATVAGLKGMILVAEATAIVTVLNAMFGTEIPTPEELMHKSRQEVNERVPENLKKASNTLGEALTYGGYSRLLGVDVSSSVAAPSLPQMISAPPAAFAVNAVKNSFNYLYAKALGRETDSLAMLAAQSLFPNAARGFIEEMFTKEGQPVPRPTDNMKGNYVRDTEEKIMAGTFALKSISEANADALARIARKQLVKDMQDKISAINVITDRMINGQEVTEEMLTRYVEEGGDIKNLPATVKKNMIERQQTFGQRGIKPGSMTPSKFHKLQIMRKALDEEARISQEKAE